MKSVLISILLISTALLGCKKNEVLLVEDHSSKYHPMSIGNTWIYEMDSIVFRGDNSSDPDTFSYLKKIEVESTLNSDSFGTSYKLISSTKKDSMSQWIYQNTYTVSNSPTEVLVSISDIRQLILSFPISLASEWDANLYNTKESLDCYYEFVHKPYTLDSITYDSTSTVYGDGGTFVTQSKFVRETYAANIGLIEKEFENVTGLFPPSSAPYGNKYYLKLRSFEK
ncbi:MAG: hypothetical protein ACPGTP_05105 [Bacteroidia bacterium]